MTDVNSTPSCASWLRIPHPLIRALLAVASFALPTHAQGIDLYDESILRDIRVRFENLDWAQDMFLEWFDNEPGTPGAEFYQIATVEIAGQVFEDCLIRYRGQTSFADAVNGSNGVTPADVPDDPYRKIPLEINLPDDKAFGVDTLRLNAASVDETYLKEVLGLRILRDLVPAPRANWVKVWLAGPEDLDFEYAGVYVNLEHMDRQFMRRILWNGEGLRWDGTHFRTQSACSQYSNLFWVTPHPAVCSLDDYAPFIEAGTIAEGYVDAPYDEITFQQLLEPTVPSDDWARYWAAWHSIATAQSEGWNGQAYQDTFHGGGIIPLPQGLDRGFMGLPPLDPLTAQEFFDNENEDALASTAEVRARYASYLRTLADSALDPDAISCWIGQSVDLLRPHIASIHDLNWDDEYSLIAYYNSLFPDEPIDANTYIQDAFAEQADGLAADLYTLVDDILTDALLASVPPIITSVTPGSSEVVSGTNVQVVAQVEGTSVIEVLLRWRHGGHVNTTSMSDQGGGTWSTSVAMPVGAQLSWMDYVVEAIRLDDGELVASVSPARGFLEPYVFSIAPAVGNSPLVINELLASNKLAATNPCTSDSDDAFEVYNPGSTAVDMAGWVITKGAISTSPDVTWIIPDSSAAVVPAGGYSVIWCVGAGQPPSKCMLALQAPFKLDADGGEQLALWSVDKFGTNLVDAVRYHRQTRDISLGRVTDGSDPWRMFTSPTLGSTNSFVVQGDFNGDGAVDTQDLLILLAAFGSYCVPCSSCPADLDGNGVVNTGDLMLFLSYYDS